MLEEVLAMLQEVLAMLEEVLAMLEEVLAMLEEVLAMLEEVLGKAFALVPVGLGEICGSFCFRLFFGRRRRPPGEVLDFSEEVLDFSEEVLGSRRGAWIQERCLAPGEVLGSRRGAWL